jgi:hypothetical protein
MSGDYTDVLTNQPVVIDNVSTLRTLNQVLKTDVRRLKGLWYDQSRFRGSRASQMLLSFFVRVILFCYPRVVRLILLSVSYHD